MITKLLCDDDDLLLLVMDTSGTHSIFSCQFIGKCTSAMNDICIHILFMHVKHMTPPDNALQRRHNEHDGISNHQPLDCLLIVYSGADQGKHQISASLAFVRGIHW